MPDSLTERLPAPLVVTLSLDPENQARFEAERRRWFPAHRNQIPAHLSLFHALPGEMLAAVEACLGAAAEATAAFALEVHDLMRLGGGVAYSVRSAPLQALHAELAAQWQAVLTAQDRQPFHPHIVVQNKVAAHQAATLYARLAGQFRPWQAEATGLLLWRYCGGPWQPVGAFSFRSMDGT